MRATDGVPTEPSYYATIFERGIDPDVDNPEICHDHSELPDEWPAVEEILVFRKRVCARIAALYENRMAWSDRKVGRALWIGQVKLLRCYELSQTTAKISVGLHLETFLYMLLQSDNVLPPPEPRPDFEKLAQEASMSRVENQWFMVPESQITHGFSDPENDEGPDRFFAWDNERPPYQVDVPAFEVQARPVSNGEYAMYIVESGKDVPTTWTSTHQTGGQGAKLESFIRKTSIKTVFGPVPLGLALDWPAMASFNEVSGYAEWKGCRIPTFNELRSIYSLVESQKPSRPGFRSKLSNSIEPDPEEIFVDLTGCNIGLQHFHPMPVTHNGNRLSGLGDMGGAWEWTSTRLAPFANFKPMDIYPGYTGIFPFKLHWKRMLTISTADFMDGKHNVVLGDSALICTYLSHFRGMLQSIVNNVGEIKPDGLSQICINMDRSIVGNFNLALVLSLFQSLFNPTRPLFRRPNAPTKQRSIHAVHVQKPARYPIKSAAGKVLSAYFEFLVAESETSPISANPMD
ncbi:MAG: hypothetical protein Q9217_004168 [Psora testacea]